MNLAINFFKNLTHFFLALRHKKISWSYIGTVIKQTSISNGVKINHPSHLEKVTIGYATYISQNAWISECDIGKFCSIGPNLICGWGIHPLNGLSTSPMFYSTREQNGMSLSLIDKLDERKHISIGNDVFVGANVTILDGVIIGDGSIIAAGAVVTNNIPPYSIAGGVPAKIIKYRFDADKINKLLTIKWWDWNIEDLPRVEEMFFDIDLFINKYYK